MAVVTLSTSTDPGLVKLGSGVISPAQANLDIIFPTSLGYRNYMFLLEDFVPATNGAYLWMRVSSNGGSTFDAGSLDYVSDGVEDSAMLLSHVAVGNTAAKGISSIVDLFGVLNTGVKTKIFTRTVLHGPGTAVGTYAGGGIRTATQDIDAVRFRFSSGNINSGSWAAYAYTN